MSHLTLEGDNVTYNPIGLQGDSSLAITLDDTGTLDFGVEFLGLSGTSSVSIGSVGGGGFGFAELHQLADSKHFVRVGEFAPIPVREYRGWRHAVETRATEIAIA